MDNLLGKASFAVGSTLAFDTTNAASGGTYTSVITGGLGLTKLGSNALYFGATNTYTGNTTLNGGILSVERTSTSNGLPVFGAGGTLYLNSGTLSAYASYFSNLEYSPTATNPFQINGSVGFGDTTSGGTASLALSGPGTINTFNPTITVSSVYNGNGTTGAVTLGSGSNTNYLTDNGNGFTKNGPGTLILGGLTTSTSAFTGPVVVNGGTLQFGGSNAGGAYTAGTPSTVTVNSGGSVSIGTYAALYASNVVLIGTGAFVPGANSGHGAMIGSLAGSGSPIDSVFRLRPVQLHLRRRLQQRQRDLQRHVH